MYRTDAIPGVPELDAGTVLLLEGPPMTGKAHVAHALLAAGFEAGEAAVVVATKKPASWYREQHGDDATLYVVDCVTAAAGHADARGFVDERTYQVGSPADLTGIGIGISQFFDRLRAGRETPPPLRLYVDSVSTLLAYSTGDQLYRFLHALTSRARATGALAICLAHTHGIDEADISRFRSLFDGAVETRETDTGTEIRVRGLDAAATASDWVPIPTGGDTR